MDTNKTRRDILSPLREEWRRLQVRSGLPRDAFYRAVSDAVAVRQGRPGDVVWGEAPAVWVDVAALVSSRSESEGIEAREMREIEAATRDRFAYGIR
jgi:hypothetical protein